LKHHLLGISNELLERHGAVSPEVAAAMASGARMQLRSDVTVAVTGIAGPSGGTPEKPVGLVYVHAATPDGDRGRELNLPGGRDEIRRRSTVVALHLLRTLLTHNRDNGV
jgi:nicotinamide-nucleotide amidase